MSAAVPEGIPMDSSAGWEMGAEVHVKDKKLVDPERVWAKGKVVGVEGQSKVNVKLDDGKGIVTVDLKKVKELYTVNPKTNYDDMTSLYYLHEPGVSENLEVRYLEDKIMSYIGRVLVVCNPFKRIPMPDPKDYIGKRLDANPPHNYAIADGAYQALVKSGGEQSQSIIISGESGAGKTESAKIVMNYITTVSPMADGMEDLPAKILAANPILEAFGNGKTTRNWNSSRFGKFTQLEIDEDGKSLCGATVETYLLEKSRVVFQGAGERNYHCFYHLFEDSTLDKSTWGLAAKESYHYINQSGVYGADMVDDKNGENGINEVLKALAAVDDDDSYAQEVYNTLAAVLWLGNIHFEGDEAKVTDAGALESCAKLFMCDPANLEKALTHESKEVAGEKFHTPLNAAAAENSRDALARNMYGRLFADLVDRVNVSLSGGNGGTAIGVLDIFGFESFQKNSFEQFCINFTNEKLQATFNQHIFNDELRLYEEEQIQWLGIVCPNNEDALTVIAGSGHGVFDILDSTCKMPRATDDKLAAELHNEWDQKKNKAFPMTNPREARNHFVIKHYAGDVKYCTDGWLTKNKDTISADVTELCRNDCSADLISALWASGRFGTFTTTTASGQKVRKKFQGLGKAFMKSINALTEKIDSTTVHFIRAIKTNAPMKPGFYQPDYVIMQLRDQGLLSLCDLLKAGYPTRIGYGELQERFAPKMPKAIMDIGLSPKDFTNALVWAYGLPKSNYQVGLTKIFFRAGKVAMLDELDNITPEQHEQLTARVKRWVIRRKWRMGVAKAIAFKKAGDLFRSVHAMHMWYKAADLMLVYIRTLRKNYFKIKGKVAARTIARTCRMWPLRQEYLKKTVETRKKKAAIVLQAACRAHLERKNYEDAQVAKREGAAALLLQRLCRMIVTKKETQELFGAKREESAARALQSLIRAAAERKKFLLTRAEGKASAEKVQRLYRLISGESGVQFKAIVNKMRGEQNQFSKEMDALVAKYTTAEKPLGQKKLFSGGGGGGGFEMWISIKLVDPSAGQAADVYAEEFTDGHKMEDVFAGNWMKMKKVEGLLGEFFSDPANATTKDADGNYVWKRDPNYFKYIMDFIRDGQVSWPTNVQDAEALLVECDYFEIGSMVLPLVDELRKIKFGGGDASGGDSGAGVLGGSAGESSAAASGPCDNYRLDMSAATFGLCKCGYPKADHK